MSPEPMPLDSPRISKIPKYSVFPYERTYSWPKKCTLCKSPNVERHDKASDSYELDRHGPVKEVLKVKVEGIPYCRSCWRRTHNYLLYVVEVLIAIGVGAAIGLLTQTALVPLIVTIGIVSFILFAVLYVGFDLGLGLHSAVTINANPNGTKFNFRNLDYAFEFANLNIPATTYNPCPRCGQRMFVNTWDRKWFCIQCDIR